MAKAPLDEDTAAFLAQLVEANAEPITSGTPDQARAANAAFLAQVGVDRVEMAEVEDIEIPGPGGGIPARRYRPDGDARAVVLYFHGGGWVLGDLEGHDTFCRLIASRTASEVVNVNYRHAPENPFPAAPDDAYAALRWAAAELAGGRPIVVAGDSAGGNLAAVTALRARDEGGPEVALQVLLYPVLDCDLDTDSYKAYGEGHLLLRGDMEWFFDHYVPDASQRTNPYVSPLRADDLAGVAPAYVAVGGYDPLYDEGVAYVERLREAGVEVRFRDYERFIHGFLTMPKAIPSTQAAIDEVMGDLAELVGQLSARQSA